jgi:diaminopimelate epimerase|tara:strand:- start:835 stop:1608 length:774 start_codon:yes stop_codon:yes gene_type:complete
MSKKITFYKYQGTGNDFIITSDIYEVSTEQIIQLCDRKYGIGADGLIVLKKSESVDFDMMYYNADGTESFCGNGSRCAVMHAKYLGWTEDKCLFNSNDGKHTAIIEGEEVRLQMHDVDMVLVEDEGYILNTGSPHYIAYTEEIDELDLITAAHAIRYNETFSETGINVNYLEARNGIIYIRTYERGVENETLSCGTGVTAAAIAHYLEKESTLKKVSQKIQTKGGPLTVTFEKKQKTFENIYLCGPAVRVYEGEIDL